VNESAKMRSILVVDDNVLMLDALSAVLGNSGYEVLRASDGMAAVACARQHGVGLLITDLLMPESEGIETIRMFVREFPRIPIVAMSGMLEYLPMAKALGATAVLKKPIARAQLLQTVRNLIGCKDANGAELI
jgi:CheY-like chemotaxis protein